MNKNEKAKLIENNHTNYYATDLLDKALRKMLIKIHNRMTLAAFQNHEISSAEMDGTNAYFEESIKSLTVKDVILALITNNPIETNRVEEENYKRSIDLIKIIATKNQVDKSKINTSYDKVIEKNFKQNGIQPLLDFMNEMGISTDDLLKYSSQHSGYNEILTFLGLDREDEEER